MDILEEKQERILFTLITRMIYVTNNFKNKYEDLMCPRCKKD